MKVGKQHILHKNLTIRKNSTQKHLLSQQNEQNTENFETKTGIKEQNCQL